MGYDRISALPDSLITEILLWLPTRDSVKTSVLSIRWRNLWLDVPGLEIDDFRGDKSETMTRFTERFLEFNRYSRLQKFKIKYDVSYYDHRFRISEWIATAINHRAQHLDVVDTRIYSSTTYYMPLDIYKSKTLVSLKLINVGMSNPDFVVSLPCLKIMHLENILYSYEDPLIMEKLIPGCPVLEDLTLCRAFDDYVPVLRVRSQTLKRFSVRFVPRRAMDGNEYAVEIDAPGLKYLDLRDHQSERNVVMKNLRSLFMIDIDYKFNVGLGTTLEMKKGDIRDFLTEISSVRHMIISQPTLEVLYRYLDPISMFHNLYRLEATFSTRLLQVLPEILESFPNLKHFTLCVAYLNKPNERNHELTIVPRGLLSTLECVEIKEVITRGGEPGMKGVKQMKKILMKAVRYILENSLVLKKLILSFSPRTNQVSDTTK